jgi:hypothetical protein
VGQNDPSKAAPEAWLRGALPGIHPLVMPVFFTFIQVREELAVHTQGLTQEQIDRRVAGSSLGFHLRHIAGSVDRLTTYLSERALNEEQLNFLRTESAGGLALTDLLALVEQSLMRCQHSLLALDPATLFAPRTVGRRALPTSVIGLIVHIAEHTQRHLGQAVTLSKILRQSG